MQNAVIEDCKFYAIFCFPHDFDWQGEQLCFVIIYIVSSLCLF